MAAPFHIREADPQSDLVLDFSFDETVGGAVLGDGGVLGTSVTY